MIERQNYHKTRKYLIYLEEVQQLSAASLDLYRFYLRHLLLWADDKDFSKVHGIRPTLPAYLASQPGKDGKGTLSGTSQKKILDTSKRFFRWAKATYPREFRSLPETWLDTLRPARQPQVTAENVFVSEDEVRQLIRFSADPDDLALLRDQAAAAFLFLSGMRGGAFVTLPIQALDLKSLTVRQWPELGVHTKNGKKATTFLLNIPDLLEPVKRWDKIVRSSLPETSPWYAPVEHCWGEQSLSLAEPGKYRLNGLHKRLKLLFSLSNLEFKSPHKFRHGHAVYGLLHAQTMADYKAVSMNLMHDSIEITDSTYAPMLSSDVQKRIAGLTNGQSFAPAQKLVFEDNQVEDFLNSLEKETLGRALVFIAEKLTQ